MHSSPQTRAEERKLTTLIIFIIKVLSELPAISMQKWQGCLKRNCLKWDNTILVGKFPKCKNIMTHHALLSHGH